MENALGIFASRLNLNLVWTLSGLKQPPLSFTFFGLWLTERGEGLTPPPPPPPPLKWKPVYAVDDRGV